MPNSNHVSLHALILAIPLALAGCYEAADDGGSDGVDTVDPSGSTGTTDKISFNGLVLHAPLLASLGTAPLTTGELQDVDLPLNTAATGGLQDTVQGRDLLEYVSRCALPRGSNLIVGDQSFPGHVGVAPEWASNTCDAECQGWVTACLLAHANLTGATVAISLRGSHPALQPTEAEVAEFSREEAAFYGNLFVPGFSQNLYGCLGTQTSPLGEDFDPFNPDIDVAAAINDTYLSERVCGAGACGFQNTGVCFLEAPVAVEEPLGACAYDAGELGYSECGDLTLFGPVFDQVITVHLEG